MRVFLAVVKNFKIHAVLVVALLFVRLSAVATQAQSPSLVPAAALNLYTYLPFVSKPSPTDGFALVFVSRRIPPTGSDYYPPANDLPGVGSYSRFRVAAPGKLLIREENGSTRTLIDGSTPGAATLNLIDVSAPDVSYDGMTIVFAGLPAGNYDTSPRVVVNAWRLYSIRVDGSGLRQITTSNMNLDLSQFGPGKSGMAGYDDTDPAWLPDGRIVFSSTRWPAFAQYSGVRASNLWVVNADGGNLHRITAERSGADRPIVDPVTGKIVYSRWWRNYRFPINDMSTILRPQGGYTQFNGLTMDRYNPNQVGGVRFLDRNAWHLATINPDGTGLAMWAGAFRKDEDNQAYGGSFMPDGDLITNFFPMHNLSEAAGFGGLRRFHRGPNYYSGIIGITYPTFKYVNPSNPTSYGIYQGNYAADPEVLPSYRIIISWAPDINQDYDLYLINPDGTGLFKLYGNPGTTELHARLIRARPLPPIIPDGVTQVASLLPPPSTATRYDQDGTFTFAALNVYANGPVDAPIVSAIPVGSAAKMRFFVDHQRLSTGSFAYEDWPILLAELPINPDGSVTNPLAPANLPLFEQVRSANNTVPFTGGPQRDGAAHVAGLNFGRTGSVARCVGCHTGHTLIAVPANDADAKFSNVAPGAQVTVSSARDARYINGVIDRKVMTGDIYEYWNSAQGQPANGQWVLLSFPAPITVRTVRLYNPRFGDEANSSLQVQATTVKLYGDAAGTAEVASQTSGALSVSGTDVAFGDVRARAVRVYVNNITGTFYGVPIASLAEVEVIARGEAGP